MNKKKEITDTIITTILTFIMLCLSTICYINLRSGTIVSKEELELNRDYRILKNTEECSNETELLYEDENNIYYLNCVMSKDLYLEWNDGTITLLKDDLENKKVTLESLKQKGLDFIIKTKSNGELNED